jgi:apolipoprotein D and lipocalin family protein
MRARLWTWLACATLAGCAQIPEGVMPISGFDATRYLGTWYEVARLDNSFERGLTRVTATYSARDDGGIDVVNRGFNEAKGTWSEARGRAKFVGPRSVGQLKVSFFGPFYGGYNIVALDPAYSLALVVGADRSYLWILARVPNPPRESVDRLVARARELGFDTASLVYVRH